MKLPVYRDATIGVDKLQPVVFSHSLKTGRHNSAALFSEMASCGFLVICIGHNDQSEDFNNHVGNFKTADTYDYDLRNHQVQIREREVITLVNEVMS